MLVIIVNKGLVTGFLMLSSRSNQVLSYILMYSNYELVLTNLGYCVYGNIGNLVYDN